MKTIGNWTICDQCEKNIHIGCTQPCHCTLCVEEESA